MAALLAILAPGANAAVPAHGRAWELVTQGNTNGVRLLGVEGWDDSGDRVGYVTFGPFPGAPSGDLIARGVAIRTASGWTLNPVGRGFTAPSPAIDFPQALAVNADLTTWIWSSIFALSPGAPADPNIGLYRMTTDGGFEPLGLGGELGGGQVDYGGDDTLQHYVFDTGMHLIPEDAGRTDGSDAYEYVGTQLRLVGVDSDEQPISPCGSMMGNGDDDRRRREHVISRDGSRIFFTAPFSDVCGVPQSVYLRTNGTDTTLISGSRCTRVDCNAQQSVTFAGATADGAHAFLVTAQQLTDDDVDEAPDLYRYDVGTGNLVRLSGGDPGTTADLADAVLRVSDDGQRVYFVAKGALLPGVGTEGSQNLYLNDHGTLRFVATLDDPDPNDPTVPSDLLNTTLSSDGGALLFESSRPLVPGDTDTSVDVYRYDAKTGQLDDVSEGVGGTGNAEIPATFPVIVSSPITPEPMRFMSGDGRRAFFVTNEALVPEDKNEAADAYEWFDGDLGLISPGSTAGDELTAFAGLSFDGRSAYIVTDETLVPADTDGGDLDIYAARIGGGFPSPPGAPPTCSGDACQGTPATRAGRAVPGSVTYTEPPPTATKRFGFGTFGTRARRQLAATGSAVFAVTVPAAGRVSLVARARIGGRTAIVGRASARAKRAGVVRLRLKLSATARRSLRRHRSLKVSLVVSHPKLGAAPALRLTLKRAS